MKNFIFILKGFESWALGSVAAVCISFWKALTCLLNNFGPAGRNTPSADPVKDVIAQVIFFFLFSFFTCKGSCSHYIKLNPDDANYFEMCPEQKLLWA